MAGDSQESRFGLIRDLEFAGALFDLAFKGGVGTLQPAGHVVPLSTERFELIARLNGDAVIERTKVREVVEELDELIRQAAV